MRTLALLCLTVLVLGTSIAGAAIYGQVRGVVHDSQHRPIAGAQVELRSVSSAFNIVTRTAQDGSFSIVPVPLGDYALSVSVTGFETVRQSLTLASDTYPVLHFELHIRPVQETVSVNDQQSAADVNTVTPTVLISREEIAQTPGADRTNSMAMITDYVPGAYMTHDMLHMRGGHQVSWLIDGVEIPNTSIASNLGAQIDPKDIDYIEVQRGSYSADVGDRTYGAFNVVPRTGFERSRQAELVLSAGSFLQTNDALSFGDHTEKLAYYVSLNGNRSDYGLSPPVSRVLHDASNGYGGFVSLIYNHTPKDQLRTIAQLRSDYFQIPFDPDPNSFENLQYNSSGLRDGQHEMDGLATFSWLHTLNPLSVLEVSPFVHYNKADYESSSADIPVATTSDRASTYGGIQAAFTTDVKGNTLQLGFYSFGQHDSYSFGATFNDASGTGPFSIPDTAAGGVIEEYVSDHYKATSWLTLVAGLRQTRFQGQFIEDYLAPRVGIALKIPRFDWVFRGFYGRFYQPPPLLTAKGRLVQFAQANDTDFQPLHGERDEEHQIGVQIPYRGWLLDADTFKTRVNNFLDHSNIGDSSIYFPITVDGALVRAWELTLRSPRLWHVAQVHLAYSNQITEQRGAITGGLICAPVGSPQCDKDPGYRPVDHDQRNTLSAGFGASLPWSTNTSANVSYGSGFTNGNPNPTTPYAGSYLPQHTAFDLSFGKTLGDRTTVSVTATNLANRRVLLDNSLTFGGFHYSTPRELFGELHYRFTY